MAVATPEGVTLEFTLAGVGSRFVAALFDSLIQGAVMLALLLLTWAFESTFGDWVWALLFLGVFVVYFGYDVAFETLNSGRTLGKQWTGLRVVKTSGAPVTFMTSAVRNLLRLVDMLPTMYGIGVVTILATSKNQRLGDLAAGTIVVRERTAAPGALGGSGAAAGSWTGWAAPTAGVDVSAWDVSAITADEVAAVRQFLARRGQITADARSRLARELAARLRPKVMAPQESLGPEVFLEGLVRAKTERGYE